MNESNIKMGMVLRARNTNFMTMVMMIDQDNKQVYLADSPRPIQISFDRLFARYELLKASRADKDDDFIFECYKCGHNIYTNRVEKLLKHDCPNCGMSGKNWILMGKGDYETDIERGLIRGN